FKSRKVFIEPEAPWEYFGVEDPRVTFFEGKYYTFYTALSDFPFGANNIKVGLAVSKDLKTVDQKYLITNFNAKAMTLFPERVNGKVTALLTVNSDLPPSSIAYIQVDEVEKLWDPDVWYEWYAQHNRYKLSLGRLNTDHVEIGCPPVATDQGWLLFYAHIRDYINGKEPLFGGECVLLDRNNLRQIIARTEDPMIVPEAPYEKEGTIPDVIFPTSLNIHKDEMRLYYGAADTSIALAQTAKKDFLGAMQEKIRVVPKLSKYHTPIIEPRHSMAWEANGTFNPGCFDDGEHIHLFYRAQSDVWTSTIGYCRFAVPHIIETRPLEPIYEPRTDFEVKRVPEGYSGCEDPRVTQFGDTVYMLYTAYDGVNPPAAAVTSIALKDVQQGNWNWTLPRLLSKPGKMDKNACLFPETFNDHYLILHRIEPDIYIEEIPAKSFEDPNVPIKFDNNSVLAGPTFEWETAKIGASCPPILIDDGWLVFYHGVSRTDSNYRIGFLVLDRKDPSKILGRTRYPILEPTLPWEKVGVVPNVVFPCGAVVRDGMMHMYYGGADQ
ncbi:MAG: hypothetical protein AAF597_13210, partial [Bacteroidota bacterium]